MRTHLKLAVAKHGQPSKTFGLDQRVAGLGSAACTCYQGSLKATTCITCLTWGRVYRKNDARRKAFDWKD